jgi:hypothetical protein
MIHLKLVDFSAQVFHEIGGFLKESMQSLLSVAWFCVAAESIFEFFESQLFWNIGSECFWGDDCFIV